MKSRFLIAAAVATLAAIGPAGAQTAPPGPRAATIVVGGQGSVDRAPDRAVVTLAVVTDDPVAAKATSANNAAYGAVVAKIAALGIPQSAIKTTSFNLNYNPRPPQPNPQFGQRYGYVVSRDMTVTTDRVEQAGAIVDAGVAGGATGVNAVGFTLRDQRGAYRAAQALAVADADAQARALAEAAHVRIVRIARIDAAPGGVTPRPVPFAARMAVGPVPTEIPASDLTVTATVDVTYQIAP
ncbi:hypothetical protein WPS_23120 [Vulcanimicrobium alpinum]|uniref:SIMPL domain-containing protein n=1 Tax=Vulcanimicrobium alpinum TaxID=3016050 RepID=A0AAN1XX70_UNVUL|nr:SIMPL domain-containing protein [Vulcanimicrobium alpinum]BDE07036.1 hypothetical protein WPS_23120 [Vulcanimicrobium alpinum]